MDYTVSPLSEWQIWHKNCIRQSGIEVNNSKYINILLIILFECKVTIIIQLNWLIFI